jgi:hypothetical protein
MGRLVEQIKVEDVDEILILVNFDHSGESVPANDIQLTRSLVLAVVLQASEYFKGPQIKKGVYALDSSYQRFVINEWLKYQDTSNIQPEELFNLLNEDWISLHSNGL